MSQSAKSQPEIIPFGAKALVVLVLAVWGGPIIMQFIDFLGIYPSTKMTITPLLVDQIEKFQCLKSSTAKDL